MSPKINADIVYVSVDVNLYAPTTLPYWFGLTEFYIMVIAGATKPLDTKMQSATDAIDIQKLPW